MARTIRILHSTTQKSKQCSFSSYGKKRRYTSLAVSKECALITWSLIQFGD